MKTIIATIIVFVLSVYSCFAGELPTLTVLDGHGNIVCHADSATFEGKFGMWMFYDAVSHKYVEASAGDVVVANMNGEYVVRGDAVYHKNSKTKAETRIEFNAFQETVITTRLDDHIVNNDL